MNNRSNLYYLQFIFQFQKKFLKHTLSNEDFEGTRQLTDYEDEAETKTDTKTKNETEVETETKSNTETKTKTGTKAKTVTKVKTVTKAIRNGET